MFDKTTFQHVANFFSIPSRTLRAGATGAGEFVYNNVARDAVSGAILSKGWYPSFFSNFNRNSNDYKSTIKKK